MDLWFHETSIHPLHLFEARAHLESVLTAAAFDRATLEDMTAMDAAVVSVDAADDARSYLQSVMDLHRVIAAASGIVVLDGMHQAVVANINATLSRADFIDGHEELLRHSRQIHRSIVAAIADHDAVAFEKLVRLHDSDLIRAGDPHKSPHLHRDHRNPAPDSFGARRSGGFIGAARSQTADQRDAMLARSRAQRKEV
jgi:DNA-binding FadR family transcriptional regulator